MAIGERLQSARGSAGSILALLLACPVTSLAQAGGLAEAVSSITAGDIQRRIDVIAHDSMRGRDTPSAELDEVAAYIAGEFRSIGLAPGGHDQTFIQHYPIKRVQLDSVASRILVARGPTWRLGDDFTNVRGGNDAPEGARGTVVVIAGVFTDPRSARDMDLAGKVAILVSGSDSRGGFTPGLLRALTTVRAQRPAAILLVHAVSDAEWASITAQQRRVTVLPSWRAERRRSGPPILIVRDRAAAPLLARYGISLPELRRVVREPARSHALPDLDMTVTVQRSVIGTGYAPNVVGILEGRDPALKNEYIVFSAHMDHVGIGRPDARGDTIYNGADDDASGTIAVVELAEAFRTLERPPRRSLLFLTVSGEEKGLWGSEYFADHPPVPATSIVANLNSDMVGRNWRDTVVVIGKEHSDLGATLQRINAMHPELDMTAIDDPWPEENFYRRSDHYNFARKGVPILFFFNGTHEDYHRPSDEPTKIDAEKESRIVKLLFYLGLEVAEVTPRPKWNPESYRSIVEGASGRP